MFTGVAFLFFGLPVSIIEVVVFAHRKKRVLIPAICLPVSVFMGLVFLFVGGILYGETDEYKQSVLEEQSEIKESSEQAKIQEEFKIELKYDITNTEEQQLTEQVEAPEGLKISKEKYRIIKFSKTINNAAE